MRGSAPAIVLPTPRRPVFPPPPRRMPPPVTPFGQGTSNQHEPLHGGAGAPQEPELGTNPAKGFPRAPVATPFVRPPALRQVQGTAAKPAPSGTFEAPPADALAASSVPGFEEIPTSPPVDVARRTEFLAAPASAIRGSSDSGCCRQSFNLGELRRPVPRKTAPFPSRKKWRDCLDARRARASGRGASTKVSRKPVCCRKPAAAMPSRSWGPKMAFSQLSRWVRSRLSWRSCASTERVAIGRASSRFRPIGSPVSSQ